MADKNIGGQAVLEGVMLREAKSGRVAIANRMQNGKIHITEKTMAPASNKHKFFKLRISSPSIKDSFFNTPKGIPKYSNTLLKMPKFVEVGIKIQKSEYLASLNPSSFFLVSNI